MTRHEPKKPNLACDAPEDVVFPVFASPKVDGIRITVWNGTPLTRALKDVPNHHIRETIKAANLPAVFDGELVVGSPMAHDCINQTTSGVMSREGRPDFTFYVFDYVDPVPGPFYNRAERLATQTSALQAFHPWFKVLEQKLIRSPEELAAFEAEQLTLGYEGLIVCNPNALYKHGRSTAKEQGKMKVKRFKDAEAAVIGFYELMRNDNPATTNALGHTERSSHKANLVPMGMLGALICRTPEGVEFEIGTGFTYLQRTVLWQIRDQLIGRLAKYKFFPVGVKDKPRHPVFLAWRDLSDV
jgi:DNA ligase-1